MCKYHKAGEMKASNNLELNYILDCSNPYSDPRVYGIPDNPKLIPKQRTLTTTPLKLERNIRDSVACYGSRSTAIPGTSTSKTHGPGSSNTNAELAKKVRSKLLECELCNRFFLTTEKLKLHYRRMHEDQNKSRVCDKCGKAFKSPQALRYHNSVHSGEKKFQCELCPKRFILNYQLTIHMRSHTGEKPFQCQVCLKRFDIFSNLTVHMRIHTNEKPFKCTKCDKAYKQFIALENHFMRAHKGETLERPPKLLAVRTDQD